MYVASWAAYHLSQLTRLTPVVATCSADHKIKLFKKQTDGTWEPEVEWKVRVAV